MTITYYALKLSLFPTIIFSIIFVFTTSNNKLATAFATDDDSSLQAMFRGEAIRQQMILHKQSLITKHQRLHSINGYMRRELVAETNNTVSCGESVFVKMPMQSGADFGIGQYLVSFKAGTPSQKFSLIMDTGSDLTWMNCKYGCEQRASKCSTKFNSKASVFQANDSSSFSTISCSSHMCKVELANLFSLALCPSPRNPCAYDYRYSDGSSAVGFFANETVTVGLTNGRKEKLQNVIIGCSQSSQGPSFRGHVAPDGVLGLGFSKTSFATKATDAFGGKFSYCLADHLSPENVSNYLTFSSARYHTPNSMIFTTLGAIGSFYAVNIRSLSIGGQILNIPIEVWDVNGVGGAIIDTGSSLTYLALPAYRPVMAALTVSLLKFQRINIKNQLFKYCFNATNYNEYLDVPRLVFHFQHGARFEPPVKSYVIDVAQGVKCIGLVPTAWPGVSVIGNIMQQNHLWEFDLVNGKLGFTPSNCS